MDYVFDSIDLREAGLSTIAKDQGNCGSCWAFSTAAVLENLVLRSQRVIRQNESLRKQWTFAGASGSALDVSEQFIM